MHKAYLVREAVGGAVHGAVEHIETPTVRAGFTLIKVAFAGLNYKDALSASGHRGITKNYPHVPGIDAAGVVSACPSGSFSLGAEVLVTGYDFGMNTWGGFQEYALVPDAWVVPLPDGLSLAHSMVMGTAAFTAALSLHKLERMGLKPDHGTVLVTGASGGVGTMAVGLLSSAGYKVMASSGKAASHQRLLKLGAAQVVDREAVNDTSGRPLLRSQWAAAIDTVGGNTLATAVKACARGGSVAVCGLVGSAELHHSVYPFLLNGVNMLGIDSAETDYALRLSLWHKLSGPWRIPHLDEQATFIGLNELGSHIELMREGKTQGRVVVAF